MAQANTLPEIEIRLFERPRNLPFRGRSFKTLSAFLRREAKRSGPWMERIANVVETLGREGWRYRRFTGKALILAHQRPIDGEEMRAYLSERFGQEVLPQIAIRERAAEEGAPPLPQADDELSRELRRLIGAESHKEDLHLGHPPEELSELLLDMSFLAQEAMEDGEVSGLLDRIREEHGPAPGGRGWGPGRPADSCALPLGARRAAPRAAAPVPAAAGQRGHESGPRGPRRPPALRERR